ncbi:MAG TPA: hypothetical protein VJ206_04650 [bacterium]|nr:hypothetical protein [bacterium]
MNPERVYAFILACNLAGEKTRYLLSTLGGGRWRRMILGPSALLLTLGGLRLFWGWPAAVIGLLGIKAMPPLLRAVRRRLQIGGLRRQARALMAAGRSASGPPAFTSWAQWPLDGRTRRAVESARRANSAAEIVIGRIDADGRVLGLFGPLPALPAVGVAGFVHRPRMRLDVVLIEDAVLIRKDFRGDEARFLREWRALAALAGKANVPAVHHVDERRCRLYKNLIPGRTVADILVARGARISYLQTSGDPAVRGLDPPARSAAVAARARPFVRVCFSEDFLRELEAQVRAMHSCGVTGMSPTFQNIVVEAATRPPWFIDFEDARLHPSRSGFVFRLAQYRDRVRLCSLYGLDPGADLVTLMPPAWNLPQRSILPRRAARGRAAQG